MSTGSSQNQTQSFLLKRFREAGIQPNTKSGQNFLIDLNLVRLLLDSARLDRRDVVLEVGTGTGSLTVQMAQRAAAVVTVELDPQLFQLASEELIDCENVTMLKQDALHNKNTIDSKVLDAVRSQLAAGEGRRFKVAANLPYSIATPLLSNLLLTDITPSTMTVTIQKELADRITAEPRTKDYSALSIWMQSQCHVEIVRILSPTVFWPRPKVHSAIIHIEVRDDLRRRIGNLRFFHGFVRAMFFHRRKFLRGVILSAFKNQLGKPDVDEVLAELKLGGNARAEELDVDTMLALSDAIERRVSVRPT